jgi:hypothetical protein
MSNQQQVTLFQQETNGGPSTKFGALVAAGMANDLGEGIRNSYAIVSIKASKFRIKYKGAETALMSVDQNGQQVPMSYIDVVIVKANPFLNKQFYAGKYAEGSNSKPDCYSLDGKVPSAQVERPQFSNCAMCPKNQFGSMIGDNGAKQKACRDTKKLAVVPLADLRNEALGGPMLFRVPPSSLKDLSTMADAMKARGYPYNSVAVRIGFDMEASHPKPTFKAVRPLTDIEADIVLELFNGDGVASVLADNDVVAEVPAQAPQNDAGAFIHEPVVPVGQPVQAAPVQAPVAQAPQVAPAAEAPLRIVAAPVAAPPPGMQGSVVQPFVPGAAPPPNPFAQAAQAPVAAAPAKKPRAPKPEVVMPAQSNDVQETVDAPAGSQLAGDISNILAGLSAFTTK